MGDVERVLYAPILRAMSCRHLSISGCICVFRSETRFAPAPLDFDQDRSVEDAGMGCLAGGMGCPCDSGRVAIGYNHLGTNRAIMRPMGIGQSGSIINGGS